VVQFVAGDGVDVAVQFPAEGGKLDFALSERPVVEQQLAHRRYPASTESVRYPSNDRQRAESARKVDPFQYFLSFDDVPEILIMISAGRTLMTGSVPNHRQPHNGRGAFRGDPSGRPARFILRSRPPLTAVRDARQAGQVAPVPRRPGGR
jgi:hypothetical protein